MKKIFTLLILSIFTVSCSNTQNIETGENNNDEKIVITTTLTPLASIANYIAGENAEVNTIVQPGFSPHTFDLKPSDIINMNKSDILLSTGLSIDNFIIKNVENPNLVQLDKNLHLIEGHEHNHDHEHGHGEDHGHEEDHEHEENHEHEEDHEHEEVFYDPHVWLSFENTQLIAKEITDILVEKDSKNLQYYENNLSNFNKEIDTLKNNFLEKINDKKINHFIIFHDAYGYLFDELEIQEDKVVVLEDTAGREPSASEMKEIIDTIEENNIKVLFIEPQFDSKLVDSLVKQNDSLEAKVLDPLGNGIDKNSYLDTMKQNLDNLLEIYE